MRKIVEDDGKHSAHGLLSGGHLNRVISREAVLTHESLSLQQCPSAARGLQNAPPNEHRKFPKPARDHLRC